MDGHLGIAKTGVPKSWAEIAVFVEGVRGGAPANAGEIRASTTLKGHGASRVESTPLEAVPYFLVSYELGAAWSAESYKELYRALRSFRSWTWMLDSVWLVQAPTGDAIRALVGPLLAAEDGLVVVEVSKPLDAVLQSGGQRPGLLAARAGCRPGGRLRRFTGGGARAVATSLTGRYAAFRQGAAP